MYFQNIYHSFYNDVLQHHLHMLLMNIENAHTNYQNDNAQSILYKSFTESLPQSISFKLFILR